MFCFICSNLLTTTKNLNTFEVQATAQHAFIAGRDGHAGSASNSEAKAVPQTVLFQEVAGSKVILQVCMLFCHLC